MQDQDHRRFLLAGPSRGLRLAVLAAASVAVMVADHRQQYLGVVRDWLSIAVYPVHWAVDAPSSAWRFASEALTTQRSLGEEKAQLRAENRELKLRLRQELGNWVVNLSGERYRTDESWGVYNGDESPALVDYWRYSFGLDYIFR